MKFTEAQLEAAIIEHLGVEGCPHVPGEPLGKRSSSCVPSTKDGAGAPSLPGIVTKKRQRIGVTLFPKSPLSRASIHNFISLMRGCKFNYGGYTGQNTQLELRAPGPYS